MAGAAAAEVDVPGADVDLRRPRRYDRLCRGVRRVRRFPQRPLAYEQRLARCLTGDSGLDIGVRKSAARARPV